MWSQLVFSGARVPRGGVDPVFSGARVPRGGVGPGFPETGVCMLGFGQDFVFFYNRYAH